MSFLDDAREDLRMVITEDVGEDAVLYLVGIDEPIPNFRGIFHSTYEEITTPQGATTNAMLPRFICMTDLLEREPTNNDKIEIRSVMYSITHVEPNSRGNAVLYLKKAPTR
jgi:hypothetical protein